MTASRSFDPAADIYDKTRPLPEPMVTHGLPAILDLVGPGGLLLDVGTGTGRISVPLLARGANLIGCDLSLRMMGRLREKLSSARLVQADAAHLPFASGRFDGVITTHVLHLVGDWQTALREFRRVLRAGKGVYINTWGIQAETCVDTRLRVYWRGRVEAHGAAWRPPGIQSREELLAEIERLGASVETIQVARDHPRRTPRDVIEGIANRVFSDTWDIPDDILAATLYELSTWAEGCYGDLDQPVPCEISLILDVFRFPG